MAWAKRVEADQDLMEAFGTRGVGMRFSELIDEYMTQWTGKCKNQIPPAGCLQKIRMEQVSFAGIDGNDNRHEESRADRFALV